MPADPVKSKSIPPKEIALLALMLPLLGLVMGGIWSYPAMKLTKDRDPWLTLLLGLGLGMTVFGIGWMAEAPMVLLAWIWLGAVVLLLLARVVFGSLGGSLEHFGMVHVATLLGLFVALFVTHLRAHEGTAAG